MLVFWGILSGLIKVAAFLPYLGDILSEKAKPERASWFIWMVLGSIVFLSQLAKGSTNSLWMPAVDTVGITIVYILSFKHGLGGFSKRDKIALTIAGIGILLWSVTREAAFALYIAIAVDAAGAWLTIIKSYEDPKSETMSMWFLSGLSGLIAAFSVGSFDIVQLSYPIYIWLINWAVVGAIFLGRASQN